MTRLILKKMANMASKMLLKKQPLWCVTWNSFFYVNFFVSLLQVPVISFYYYNLIPTLSFLHLLYLHCTALLDIKTKTAPSSLSKENSNLFFIIPKASRLPSLWAVSCVHSHSPTLSNNKKRKTCLSYNFSLKLEQIRIIFTLIGVWVIDTCQTCQIVDRKIRHRQTGKS